MKKKPGFILLTLMTLLMAGACNHPGSPLSPSHANTNSTVVRHSKAGTGGVCPESFYGESLLYVGYEQSGPEAGWASDPLGGSSDDTIGSGGCLLTCLAMIAPGRGTNPGQLNSALLAAGQDVYFDDGGKVRVPDVVTKFFKYPCYDEDPLETSEDFNDRMYDYMNENDIIIAHVQSRYGTPAGHYVLVVGQDVDQVGACRFIIADPDPNSTFYYLDQYTVIDLRVINAGGINFIPTQTPTPSPTSLPGVPTPTPTMPINE